MKETIDLLGKIITNILTALYIMHGSYNWTRAANYNGETLVTTVDRELVRDFADEFLKMYNENR